MEIRIKIDERLEGIISTAPTLDDVIDTLNDMEDSGELNADVVPEKKELVEEGLWNLKYLKRGCHGENFDADEKEPEKSTCDTDADLQIYTMAGIRQIIKGAIHEVRRHLETLPDPSKIFVDEKELAELERLLPIIMAAPDLLEAAEEIYILYGQCCMGCSRNTHDRFKKIGRAIDKAKGESDG